MNNTLILTVGNIGTCKSTYVKKINKNNNHYVINTDNLVRMFNSGEYKFDINRKNIYYECMHNMIGILLENNQSVIVDNPNLTIDERLKLIITGLKYKTEHIVCIDFGKGNNKSLNRRLNDSRNVDKNIWKNIHNNFLNKYEKPELNERFTSVTRMY